MNIEGPDCLRYHRVELTAACTNGRSALEGVFHALGLHQEQTRRRLKFAVRIPRRRIWPKERIISANTQYFEL